MPKKKKKSKLKKIHQKKVLLEENLNQKENQSNKRM